MIKGEGTWLVITKQYNVQKPFEPLYLGGRRSSRRPETPAPAREPQGLALPRALPFVVIPAFRTQKHLEFLLICHS